MQAIFGAILRNGIIEIFSVAFLATNFLTFLLYAIDKKKAVGRRGRIRESVLIFFTIALGGIGAWLGMVLMRHKTNHRKFKVAAVIGLVIAVIPIIHIAHALTLDRVVRYVEIDFYNENLPPELDGFRVAFMTDFHVIPHEDMREVVNELNRRDINLILLGGDFSLGDNFYRGTLAEIARANATHGIWGVEGNHDDLISLTNAKTELGIGMLINSGVQIADGFYLAGVRDLWWGVPDVAEATAGATIDDFIILITHNPDVSAQQPTAHVDLILAGHTHGGQITFFGFPMYLLRNTISDYGTRFSGGFAYSADGVPVFTSRGIGVYYHTPRIFARPEVVIFTMRAQ